ncbi:MAG: PH domain-containing protein [Lachnotalea sp.]
MNMKFPGRIGVGVLSLLIALNVVSLWTGFRDENTKTFILLCLIFFLVDALLIDLSIRNYTIIREDGILEVRLGFFKQVIPCKDIKLIKRTRNPLAGMSLSSKRLDVRYMGGRALISVKDETNFLNTLKDMNPQIEIN